MTKFQKGRSGNPKGRPVGIIDRRKNTREILYPKAQEIITKVIDLALKGNIHALRLCMERLIPVARDEPIGINLPENLSTTDAIVAIGNEVLRAIERQEITPNQAKSMMEALKAYNQTILDLDFDRRLTQLEGKQNEGYYK